MWNIYAVSKKRDQTDNNHNNSYCLLVNYFVYNKVMPITRTINTPKRNRRIAFIQRKNTNLQLLKCEAATGSNTGVVFEWGTSDHWSQTAANWSGCDASSFLDTVVTPSLLSGWLIEPCSHISLPILMEMAIWNHVITLWRHDSLWKDRMSTHNENDKAKKQHCYQLLL